MEMLLKSEIKRQIAEQPGEYNIESKSTQKITEL